MIDVKLVNYNPEIQFYNLSQSSSLNSWQLNLKYAEFISELLIFFFYNCSLMHY